MRALALITTLLIATPLPAQLEVGLNVNAPIAGGNISAQIQPQVIAELGVDCVRINCILGSWSSPSDTALFGNPPRTWFETYDAIVDGFLAEGIESYMLIGAEAVAGSSRDAYATDAWTQDYADNFRVIVEHFAGRVSVFETFNEPNDWAGGQSPQVEPRWFAYQLQEIWREVKIEGGHDVKIVTGPLFSHDIGGSPSPGDSYWTQVRQAGVNGDAAIPGLDWSAIHSQTGSYPYDGIGYHIYVLGESDDPAAIAARYTQHLDAMWSTITALEGANTPKQFWVSEFGWNRDSLTTGLGAAEAPAAQGRNLDTAHGVLRADPRVAQAEWFSLLDFAGIGNSWGLYTDATLADSARNPAWWHMRWQGLIGDGASSVALNPGFETGSLDDWTEYGATDGVIAGSWFQGITAHSGSNFHGAAANFGQKNGGISQQIATTPGSPVTVGVRVLTYREGGSEGDTTCRVGIDPTGGTNPEVASVVWSEVIETQGFWRPLVAEAIAAGDTVTVFLDHHQAAPTWNITCFDDVVTLTTSPPAGLALVNLR